MLMTTVSEKSNDDDHARVVVDDMMMLGTRSLAQVKGVWGPTSATRKVDDGLRLLRYRALLSVLADIPLTAMDDTGVRHQPCIAPAKAAVLLPVLLSRQMSW